MKVTEMRTIIIALRRELDAGTNSLFIDIGPAVSSVLCGTSASHEFNHTRGLWFASIAAVNPGLRRNSLIPAPWWSSLDDSRVSMRCPSAGVTALEAGRPDVGRR
jgi:hypothetical protein